jgi:hypothetical protein
VDRPDYHQTDLSYPDTDMSAVERLMRHQFPSSRSAPPTTPPSPFDLNALTGEIPHNEDVSSATAPGSQLAVPGVVA